MFFSVLTMRQWFISSTLELPRFQSWCACSAIFLPRQRVSILPFPLNMFPGFTIALLTLCPTFIGTSSGGWHPRLSCWQCPFHLNSWKNWLALIRATMPLLPGPRSGWLHSAILGIWPEEVHQLLCTAGQVASQWLSMPNLWMDLVPLCHLPGGIRSTLFYQSLALSSLFITYRRGFFPDPLINCLCLKLVIWGIKRIQGSPKPNICQLRMIFDDHL